MVLPKSPTRETKKYWGQGPPPSPRNFLNFSDRNPWILRYFGPRKNLKGQQSRGNSRVIYYLYHYWGGIIGGGASNYLTVSFWTFCMYDIQNSRDKKDVTFQIHDETENDMHENSFIFIPFKMDFLSGVKSYNSTSGHIVCLSWKIVPLIIRNWMFYPPHLKTRCFRVYYTTPRSWWLLLSDF